MSSFLSRVGLALLAVALLTAGARAQEAASFELRLATGAEGGAYHAIGERLAALAGEGPEQLLTITALPSRGSVSSIRMLLGGEAELAIVQADVLYQVAAPGGLEGAAETLRAVGALMPEVLHIVVRPDAGIESFEDLIERRVAAGVPGSGTALSFEALLHAHRMEPPDIDRAYLSDAAAAARLAAGEIDAWVTAHAAPSPLVQGVLARGEGALLPLAPAVLRRLSDTSPALRRGALPDGAYPEAPANLPVASVQAVLAARADVADALVSEALRLVVDHSDALREAHPRAAAYPLADMATDLPVPLHDGAYAFYQSRRSLALPIEVEVGVYLLDLAELDLRRGQVEVDLWVWFRWTGPYPRGSERARGFPFEIINGTILEKTAPQIERFGALSYATYRVRALLRGHFPLHRYPFDRQVLPIHIESPSERSDQLRFVPDTRPQFGGDLRQRTLDPAVRLSDWEITGVRQSAADRAYMTDFGSPIDEAVGNPHYSRYTFEVELERMLLPYVLKLLLPLLVIVLTAFSVFFIPARELQVQAMVVILALLACVVFHITQADALPEVGYLVTADKFFIASYVVIFLTLVQVIAQNALHHRGREALAARLARLARVVYPAAFLAALAWLSLRP